jgi:hypothetical protein
MVFKEIGGASDGAAGFVCLAGETSSASAQANRRSNVTAPPVA